MKRLIKSLLALLVFGLQLIATYHLLALMIIWVYIWIFCTVTGILYQEATKAQASIRSGWRWWWQQPGRLYQWTLPRRKQLKDLIEAQS